MTRDISGDWHGVLDTGTMKVRLGFRIDGETAWLITRAQGVVDLPLWRRGDEFGFRLATQDVGLALKATDEGLAGTCRHNGVFHPVCFARGTAPPPASEPRPQTPAPPFPYAAEPVSFLARDGARLAGTLTLPPGPGPHPAVVLSTWHGPVDRDQTVAGHRPFAIWADAMTRRGFATLRFDKRGVGASEGEFHATTTRQSADDLGHAVGFLRTRPEIEPARIGLIGHSEGAHISADAAAADPAIAFCVMLTPAGAPEEQVLETELFRAEIAVGGRPVDRDFTLRLVQDLARIEREAASADAAVAGVRALMTGWAQEGRFPMDRVEPRATLAASPWRLAWARYDPVAGLKALTCPTLVVFAERDLQASPERHAPAIEAVLAGRANARILTFPGLNHLLQHAVTGAPSEYRDIAESLAPEVAAAVCDWVAETLPPSPSASR